MNVQLLLFGVPFAFMLCALGAGNGGVAVYMTQATVIDHNGNAGTLAETCGLAPAAYEKVSRGDAAYITIALATVLGFLVFNLEMLRLRHHCTVTGQYVEQPGGCETKPPRVHIVPLHPNRVAMRGCTPAP